MAECEQVTVRVARLQPEASKLARQPLASSIVRELA